MSINCAKDLSGMVQHFGIICIYCYIFNACCRVIGSIIEYIVSMYAVDSTTSNALCFNCHGIHKQNNGTPDNILPHQDDLIFNKDKNPFHECDNDSDTRQQEPNSKHDESNTQCPDNSVSRNSKSLQETSTEETNCQHLRSQGIYEKSGQPYETSATLDQMDLQHIRSQGIYEKAGNSEEMNLQHKRRHGRFGRLKRNVEFENVEHGQTTQSSNISQTKARSTRKNYYSRKKVKPEQITQSSNISQTTAQSTKKNYYSRKPRPIKETCKHGLEITNDFQDVRAMRSAFERIKAETRKKSTYRKKMTTCRKNVTRTKRTRRRTEAISSTTIGVSNVGEMESTTIDHLVKKRNVEEMLDINQELVDKRKKTNVEVVDEINVETVDKRKKRNIQTDNINVVYDKTENKRNVDPISVITVDDSIIGKLNQVLAVNAGLRRKRAINTKNAMDEAQFRRQKRAIRPNHAINDNRFESDERFDVKYEPALISKAETLLNRDKRFVSESKMQYVSRGAREKAYRSYEDYKKKTKHECPEDRVCRLFKQEMNREDSFDGMGVWNE
ncbi:hypothetical protein WDU94_002277 [Cyamophila willieti]